MLHIITPLYRYENIELIYNSILRNDDIVWHISHSNKRDLPDLSFLKNKNIKIYSVDCEDNEIFKKPAPIKQRKIIAPNHSFNNHSFNIDIIVMP